MFTAPMLVDSDDVELDKLMFTATMLKPHCRIADLRIRNKKDCLDATTNLLQTMVSTNGFETGSQQINKWYHKWSQQNGFNKWPQQIVATHGFKQWSQRYHKTVSKQGLKQSSRLIVSQMISTNDFNSIVFNKWFVDISIRRS